MRGDERMALAILRKASEGNPFAWWHADSDDTWYLESTGLDLTPAEVELVERLMHTDSQIGNEDD